MKLHTNLVYAVIDALKGIFWENKYADRYLEKILKSDLRWGARDRAFIAENTYEIVRYWRLYWTLLGSEPENRDSLLFKIIGIKLLLEKQELPNWEEFKGLESSKIFRTLQENKNNPAIIESIPDWLNELGNESLGDKWNDILRELNQPAKVILRSNSLLIEREELRELLNQQGISSVLSDKNSVNIILSQRKSIFKTDEFKKGYFEVQDLGSQLISEYLEVAPGMQVIDACAGAGGKSLHLAAQMNNTGRIVSLDVEQWKLDELRKRARRAGVSNVETRLIDGSKTIKRLHGKADRLLLDVPCSGLGVLKRNPDAKWKLSKEFIDQVAVTQAGILDRYSEMVKIGGRMVYATCSILQSENDFQIDKFIETKSDKFRLVKKETIYPSEINDGYFIALIERIS